MGTRSLSNIRLKLDVQATLKNLLAAGGPEASALLTFAYNPTVSTGVSEDQASRAIKYSGSIASAGSETIDLYDFAGIDMGAGAGLDALGQAIVIEEIGLIIVKNTSPETGGKLEVEPGATVGWSPIGIHTVATGGALDPDGFIMKGNLDTLGFDVTDASSHTLKLTANGGDVTFDLFILGRHDDDESSSSSSSSSQSSSSSSESSSSQSSSSSS